MLDKNFIEKNTNCRVFLFDTIDSTNNFAKTKLQENTSFSVIADSQTNGRGRQGNSFFSPFGTGVYMSYVIYEKLSLENAKFITPLVAVATSRAIEKVFSVKTKIKWVNDIYYNGKKICGILCESQFDDDYQYLKNSIIGIGINVYEPDCGFPDDISDKASYILKSSESDKRNELIVQIIKEINTLLNNFDKNTFIDEYRAKDFLKNKTITTNSGKEFKAIAVGNDFELICCDSNGNEIKFNSGEISIKKSE